MYKRDENKIFETLATFKKEAELLNLNVYAVMLKGSQNYNLDDEESDIDANLIFIPTPSQIRKNDAYKITLPEGECTCHNIYAFAEIVAKGNPQWIEVCHTTYKIGESLDIFKHYTINPSALKGMVMEKVAAFDRLYPSRAHMVEKYGYDPKQLHHIIRLKDLLASGLPIIGYNDFDKEYLISVKRGYHNKTDAETIMKGTLLELEAIYNDKKLEYKPQPIDYELIDQLVIKSYKGE